MEGRSVITFAIVAVAVILLVLFGFYLLSRRHMREFRELYDQGYPIPEVHYARDGTVNRQWQQMQGWDAGKSEDDIIGAQRVALWMPDQARPSPTLHNLLLTPRVLERANIRRKMRDKRPLSRAGFHEAINNCPVHNRDTDDWIDWLIRFDAKRPEHMQDRVTVDDAAGSISVTVQPVRNS